MTHTDAAAPSSVHTISVADAPPFVATVSAVIVTFKTGPSLWECLQTVLDDPSIHEIVIVDNGNTTEDERRLSALEATNADRVKLLRGHGNIGFGRACNLGARASHGTHILFLNPDAVLAPDAVSNFLSVVKSAPFHPLLLGGRLITGRGDEQRGARRSELTLWSAFVTFSGLSKVGKWLPAFRDVHLEGTPMPEAEVLMPVVSGALMFLSRSSFERLQGFDEAYFLHVEDIDICRRTRTLGGQVMFVPQAWAKHYGSTSKASRVWIEMEKAKGLNIYFRKFAKGLSGQVAARLLGPTISLAMWVRAVWLVTRERARVKAWAGMREQIARRRAADAYLAAAKSDELGMTSATMSVVSSPRE